MKESRISTKGQIVIPKYLRDALSLSPGSSVLMSVVDNKLMIMKKPGDPLKSLQESGVSMKNIRRDIKPE